MATARPDLVFASGQLLTDEVWAPQAAALAEVATPRFSDHGRDDTIVGMAARLLAEGPPRFHLMAHAMGGFTAFEVMRQAPRRVLSLMLVATLATSDGPAQTERRRGYIRLVEGGRFDAVVEERIPILVHPARREDAPLLDTVRRMARETGPERFLGQQRAIMGRIDSRPSLAAITVPTLLVRGAQDGITTEDQQQEMLASLPNGRLITIEDCGHLPTLEKPQTTNGIVLDWLRQVAA